MERKREKQLYSGLLSGFLAAELVLLSDAVTAFLTIRVEAIVFLLAWLVAALGIHFCRVLTPRRKKRFCAGILLTVLANCLVSYGVWYATCRNAAYASVDSGKETLFEDKNIMVIVPHQDDEINILGGVLEEYVAYGSNVRIVYVTNGDAGGIPETRLQEALAYGEFVGIPKENVIFLGYGDQWDPSGGHLYNAPEDTVLRSCFGREQTYGLETHPAYREGRAYTSENLMSDLESVILEYRPDTIYCIDYDSHNDHRASMLWFERVMGKICREQEAYSPVVLKGYAYNTAWYAEEDYYDRINILSTKNIFEEPYFQQPAVYRWQERVRLPISMETLSHSLISSRAYESLEKFSSQGAQLRAIQIVNGDRVFWQRRTDSLCADAEISVSSGDAALLNDFLLIDNKNLKEQECPYDSVWTPEWEDEEKTVRIRLKEPSDIYSVVLYDHPDEAQNVSNAVIRFDDGTEVETGPLCDSGAKTQIPVEKTGVKWVEITLAQTQGECAGLTEVELLPKPEQDSGAFLKTMDMEGNFVYDYYFAQKNAAEFSLYSHGISNFRTEDCVIECSSAGCEASFTEGNIRVVCPEGETCVVTVTHVPTGICDSIRLSHLGAAKYYLLRWGQQAEAFGAFRARQMAVCRAARVLWRKIV